MSVAAGVLRPKVTAAQRESRSVGHTPAPREMNGGLANRRWILAQRDRFFYENETLKPEGSMHVHKIEANEFLDRDLSFGACGRDDSLWSPIFHTPGSIFAHTLTQIPPENPADPRFAESRP